MKAIKYFFAAALAAITLAGCDSVLDQSPDNIITNSQAFGDEKLLTSVLANLYGRANYMDPISDNAPYEFTRLDECEFDAGGPETNVNGFGDNLWRTYDYGYIRSCNQFLEGLRGTDALSAEAKKPYEGEVRFLRAWSYFNMARSLGGMPLIGDTVYSYNGPDDVAGMRVARSTEAQTYDYIINECQAAYSLMNGAKYAQNTRANKWTARILEARAALYAASLANFNNQMYMPIRTEGGEVGIPANRAQDYYQKALAAAKDIIDNSPYTLQDNNADKGVNFYEATTVKNNNTEVMWAHEFSYPKQNSRFTNYCIPLQFREDVDGAYMGITLNLVEKYEPVNTATPGEGEKIKTKNEDGSYVFYDSPDAPFKDRDPRLYGTVLYPGAKFKGEPTDIQAGQLVLENGQWVTKVGDPGSTTSDGRKLTSINGPQNNANNNMNKSGFYPHKFVQEASGSSRRNGDRELSWWVFFRVSEAYLIASEASFFLNNQADALAYINKVRERAGVKDLHALTLDNFVHENAVEFAMEGHRWWDLKRWRIADRIWNGNSTDENARKRILWPYQVNAPGNPNDGKWVFIEDFSFMAPNALKFELRNYYNFWDNGWLSNNPLLVKNPYQ